MTTLFLDSLCGPTHSFGGLSTGNLASMAHQFQVSNPKLAALEGLDKMKRVMDSGVHQLVLPPHPRPYLPALPDRVSTDSIDSIHTYLSELLSTDPQLVASLLSSSSMWMANAATLTPHCDSLDHRYHMTPANLLSMTHRSFETAFTSHILAYCFPQSSVIHHPPLPHPDCDEGAANLCRFSDTSGKQGVYLFVYGDSSAQNSSFMARQQESASRAIASSHQLPSEDCFFMAQRPEAIDAGVFHNDVCGFGVLHYYIYHALAYTDEAPLLALGHRFYDKTGIPFRPIVIPTDKLSLEVAVETYFFNAQAYVQPSGRVSIIFPERVKHHPMSYACVQYVCSLIEAPVDVSYVSLMQSMANGGGPACCRLSLMCDRDFLSGVHSGFVLTESRYDALRQWIETYYPSELTLTEICTASQLQRSYEALEALCPLLDLPEGFLSFPSVS